MPWSSNAVCPHDLVSSSPSSSAVTHCEGVRVKSTPAHSFSPLFLSAPRRSRANGQQLLTKGHYTQTANHQQTRGPRRPRSRARTASRLKRLRREGKQRERTGPTRIWRSHKGQAPLRSYGLSRETFHYSVCVCVCARARARVRVCANAECNASI
jgi:hypothetical protein